MDLAEYYNKAIAKSTKNLLTFLPPTFLPLASLLPAFLSRTFKPLVSLPFTAFKKFNHHHASASLKRQADRIAVQNV